MSTENCTLLRRGSRADVTCPTVDVEDGVVAAARSEPSDDPPLEGKGTVGAQQAGDGGRSARVQGMID